MKFKIIIALTILNAFGCVAQSNKLSQKKEKTMNSIKTDNPLLCDPASGICELPDSNTFAEVKIDLVAKQKTIRVLYFTDPICSSCWGIEPQLRKLKLAYGEAIEIEYRMGGLLPDWSYNSGGISKPSDVAHHWDEVSSYYEMPIDGDIWLEDPLMSSYPPSIAFKAAQIQSDKKAILFLRRIREMVFLEKKNITKWAFLESAALEVGLNSEKMKTDCEGKAKDLFQEDLALAQQLGVRGFPTLFFSDNLNNQSKVYGAKPYSVFENSILTLAPKILKNNYETTPKALFEHYSTLTNKEFSILSDNTMAASEQILNTLFEQKLLQKIATKNGILWIGKTTRVLDK